MEEYTTAEIIEHNINSNTLIKIVEDPSDFSDEETTYSVYVNCELIMECLTEDDVEQLTVEEILKAYDRD